MKLAMANYIPGMKISVFTNLKLVVNFMSGMDSNTYIKSVNFECFSSWNGSWLCNILLQFEVNFIPRRGQKDSE